MIQTYVSTRHPATLRRGTIATMHRFRPADLRTACSRRLAMVYRVTEAESAPALNQYRLCAHCAKLEPTARP